MMKFSTKTEQQKAIGLKDTGAPTIFDKILAKEIPSTIVYEDEDALAFRDVGPQAPTHILVIPKNRNGLTMFQNIATEEHKRQLGHLMWVTAQVAKQENLDEGYRVVINNGD